MNVFGRYTPHKEAEQPAPTKSPTECVAHGCPLPGAYRISNEASVCCVHDEEDAHRWPHQTERILTRSRLWRLTLALSNALPGEPILESTVERVVADGGPNAEGLKTQRAYAYTLRAFLVKEAKGDDLKAPVVHMSPVKTLVAKLTAAA